MTLTVNPYATTKVSGRAYLHGLNPLAVIAGVLPAMVILILVRDLVTPLLFLALAYVLLLTGAKLGRRALALLFVGLPLAIGVIGLSFSFWVNPQLVSDTPVMVQIGPWSWHQGALEISFATALRLGAIVALALVGGLTSTGPALVRSIVQYLKLPYRIGYTALSAYRFVPRFGYELSVIRAAHRVRGQHGGRGPLSAVARWFGYVVPLLAGAIRHAERVALSMDSRAFGAHSSRTEPNPVPFRSRDWVFIIGMLAVSAVILVVHYPWVLS